MAANGINILQHERDGTITQPFCMLCRLYRYACVSVCVWCMMCVGALVGAYKIHNFDAFERNRWRDTGRDREK